MNQQVALESVPREESIQAFFEDLGIGEFVTDTFDWRYSVDDLDQEVISHSLTHEGGERKHRLTRKASCPGTARQIGMEPPHILTFNWEMYIFLFAKWQDGHFLLETLRIGRDDTVSKEWHTIPQLRKMIDSFNGACLA